MYEEIQPLHEKQYEILEELKRVCDKNGLMYYLAFGTLLGAIRHKGFIPWDDDIDTGMPIADYRKLEKLFEKGEFKEGFFLQTANTDPNSGQTYYKLRSDDTTFIVKPQAHRDMHHGIDIDIYPLYNVADNKILREIQALHAVMYMLLEVGEIPQNNGGFMKAAGAVILFLIRGKTRERYKKFCLRYMARYEGKNTKYKAHFYGNLNRCRRIYPAEVFEKTIPMQFETDTFSVPVGYDYFLKKFYGDYMKMPPVEKRGVKLDKLAKIDTEHSYLDYKGTYYCVKDTQKQ